MFIILKTNYFRLRFLYKSYLCILLHANNVGSIKIIHLINSSLTLLIRITLKLRWIKDRCLKIGWIIHKPFIKSSGIKNYIYPIYKNYIYPIYKNYIYPIYKNYIYPIYKNYIYPIYKNYIYPIYKKFCLDRYTDIPVWAKCSD